MHKRKLSIQHLTKLLFSSKPKQYNEVQYRLSVGAKATRKPQHVQVYYFIQEVALPARNVRN